MKRAAAIIGPTPPFVRWSIQRTCPYRDFEDDPSPQQTFAQLRGLREVSVCRHEERVIDGFGIHSTLNRDVESARGFAVTEVLDFFDLENVVEEVCGPCPANALRTKTVDRTASNNHPQLWAGCYGWFFAEGDSYDRIAMFEQLASNSGDSSLTPMDCFHPARRLWFQIWQTSVWDNTHIRALQRLLGQLNTSGHTMDRDFETFIRAVDTCCQNQLVLQTELVPRGYSNGQTWEIAAHCSQCKNDTHTRGSICQECGRDNSWRGPTKRKVLGLRPYMLLRDLVGAHRAQKLIDQFHRKSDHHASSPAP